MNILKYFKSSKQNLILWVFAFLFLLTSFILSFFNLTIVEEIAGVETYVSGVDLCFGKDFNAFILISWILILGAIATSILSIFFKKIQVLHSFFVIIPIMFYAFLPQIINAPLGDNPELTRYLSTNYTIILAFLIIFLALNFTFSLALNLEEIKFTTKEICELAMLIGLALVLNFYPKISIGASGGSINFQIVPLIIIALRFSPFKSFIASGFIFGLITCLTDGYGLFSFPLEYLIAFGSTAIISPFRNFILKVREGDEKKYYAAQIGLLVALIIGHTLIRFMAGSISSFVFYLDYLDAKTFAAAVIYNAPYILPTGAVTLGIICALYYPILRINKIFKNK